MVMDMPIDMDTSAMTQTRTIDIDMHHGHVHAYMCMGKDIDYYCASVLGRNYVKVRASFRVITNFLCTCNCPLGRNHARIRNYVYIDIVITSNCELSCN